MPSTMRMPLPSVSSTAQRADDDANGLWLLAGKISLYLALIKGYGAIDDGLAGIRLKPLPTFLLTLLTLGTTVLLSPRGRILRVRFPAFITLYLVWWLMSSMWSEFPLGFRPATLEELSAVIALIVLVGLLPREVFITTLVNTYYVMVALILIAMVVQPSKAANNLTERGGVAVAGWHGAFLHKNFMTPALIFGTMCVLLVEHRVARKRIVVFVTLVLIILSNSSTGLATYMAVGFMYWWINRLVHQNRRMGVAFVLSTLLLMVGLVWAGQALLPYVLDALGKDATFSGRTEIWNGVINAINQHPWRGWGYGGVWFDFTTEPTRSINKPLGFPVSHAHNAWLEMLLRLGIVGLVLWLGAFFAMITSCARLLRTDPFVGKAGVLLAVLIGMFSVSEPTIFGVWLGLIVALRILSISAGGHDRRRPDPSPLLRRTAPTTGSVYTKPRTINPIDRA